ncbi:MAG: hypothetical protein H7346_22410 [Burkholderiaceae bacterium]|nr:hypothetical protein [Burkholderiaceae bacterium]
MKLPINVRHVLRDSIRIYFAPLTGAIKGIRSELHRVDREAARRRQVEPKKINDR